MFRSCVAALCLAGVSAQQCVTAASMPNPFDMVRLGPGLPAANEPNPLSPVNVFLASDIRQPMFHPVYKALFYCQGEKGKLFVYQYDDATDSWDHYHIVTQWNWFTTIRCGAHSSKESTPGHVEMAIINEGILFVGTTGRYIPIRYLQQHHVVDRVWDGVAGKYVWRYSPHQPFRDHPDLYYEPRSAPGALLTMSPWSSIWGGKVYFRASNNAVYNFYHSGGTWHLSKLQGGSNNVNGPLHYVNGKIFYKGSDNKAWVYHWDSTASTWRQGHLHSGCAPISGDLTVNPSGKQVYYKAYGREMLSYWWSNNAWHCATLPGPANLKDRINLHDDGKIFYQGTDNKLWVRYWAHGNWQNGKLNSNCPGNVKDNVKVAGDGNEVYVLYRNQDKNLDFVWWSPETHSWRCDHSAVGLPAKKGMGNPPLVLADLTNTNGFCAKTLFVLNPGGLGGMAQMRLKDMVP